MAGTAIVSALVLGVVAGGFGINQIRYGGPLHHRNQQVNDLVADILPPPNYVIEPFLEATILAQNPQTLPTHRDRLKQLEDQFQQEAKRWQGADLDDDLKQRLFTQSDVTARQFWAELDNNFLPAIEQNQPQRMTDSYRQLAAIYATHRAQIDALVTASTNRQNELNQSSGLTLTLTFVG
ncbi:MAG TPA: hypothetical protein VFF94_02050, partial [Novosphingobium sp.]|nr:hypothetical protein [Novosphingobium sp.]